MNSIKTKTLFLAIVTGFTYVTAFAQQIRSVGDFTGIKSGDSFTISISQGEANSLKINAPEGALSQVKTEVKDGILNISTEADSCDLYFV